jgi:hypothetical protein
MVQVATGVKVGTTVQVATGVKVAAGVQVMGGGVGVDVAAAIDAGVGDAGPAQALKSRARTMTGVARR